jgi:hypothetical protein
MRSASVRASLSSTIIFVRTTTTITIILLYHHHHHRHRFSHRFHRVVVVAALVSTARDSQLRQKQQIKHIQQTSTNINTKTKSQQIRNRVPRGGVDANISVD